MAGSTGTWRTWPATWAAMCPGITSVCRPKVTALSSERPEGSSVLKGGFVFLVWAVNAPPVALYIDTTVTPRGKKVKYGVLDLEGTACLQQSYHRPTLMHASHLKDKISLCWWLSNMCLVASKVFLHWELPPAWGLLQLLLLGTECVLRFIVIFVACVKILLYLNSCYR